MTIDLENLRYRYLSYYNVIHLSSVTVSNEINSEECLATISFSKLYEHEDFLIGEIFLEWKKVNMDINKFRLLCFEVRDWRNKGELRLGSFDEIEMWDWEE